MRIWLFGGLAVVVSFLLALFLLRDEPPNCPISRAGLKSIQIDMRREMVVDLLGVPVGNYASGPVVSCNPPLLCLRPEPDSGKLASTHAYWSDDQTGVHIEFDEEARVLRAFAWSQERDDGLLGSLLRGFQ